MPENLKIYCMTRFYKTAIYKKGMYANQQLAF